MNGRRLLLTACIALPALVALLPLEGCGLFDETCDPGQTLANRICIVTADAGAARSDATEDGTAKDGGGDQDTATSCAPGAGFGDSCLETVDCRCGTNLCARQGKDPGFCTMSGCLGDPSICPAGWSCFDASTFVPGLSLCVKG